MIRLTILLLSAMLLLSSLFIARVHAADPMPSPVLPYQGRLLEGDQPVDDEREMTFAIHDADGTELWSSGGQTITVNNGMYAVLLGGQGMPEIPSGILGRSGLRLRVSVEGDPLDPDLALVPALHALRAWEAETVTGVVDVAHGGTGATSAAAARVNLGIGEDGVASTWLVGSGAPDDGDGTNGDWYLDSDTAEIYEKLNGSWVFSGQTLLAKRNLSATTDPDETNDSSEGYGLGSLWINTATGKAHLCVDATVGSAEWLGLAHLGGAIAAIQAELDGKQDALLGSETNATLRWDGSAWVENTLVQHDASGNLSAEGALSGSNLTAGSLQLSDQQSYRLVTDEGGDLRVQHHADDSWQTHSTFYQTTGSLAMAEDWQELGLETSTLAGLSNTWTMITMDGTSHTNLLTQEDGEFWGGTNGWYNAGPIGDNDRALGAFWTNHGGTITTIASIDIEVPDSGTFTLEGDFYLAWARFASNSLRWGGISIYVEDEYADAYMTTVTNADVAAGQEMTWFRADTSPARVQMSHTFTTAPGTRTLYFKFATNGSGPNPSPPAGIPSGDRRQLNLAIDNLRITSPTATTNSFAVDGSGSYGGSLAVGQGLSVDGRVQVADTTASTNTTSGALQVAGGVGIAKSLFVAEDIHTEGGLAIREGANARMGTAVLDTDGEVTVPTTVVTADSRIFLTIQSPDGTVGKPYVNARTAGTSFTIKSTNADDRSTVAWVIIEPSP